MWSLLLITINPVFVVAMLLHGEVDVTLPLVLALFAMPLAVIAHELAHAVVGRLVGLEIGGISIGHGKLLWTFRIRSVPVRVHLAPVSGRVYFGAETTAFLRTRLWLSILAGPLSHIVLIAITAIWWRELEPVLGGPLILVWVLVNAFMFLGNLFPHRGTEAGQPYRSDGLQLWELPRIPNVQLHVYRSSSPIVRAMFFFEAHDYERSRHAAERVLKRLPDSNFARVMLSANSSNLGDHQTTLTVLEPLVKCADQLDAPERAVVFNNVAFALTMLSKGARDAPALAEADRLSASAFAAYPCALAYRSTRALILVAMGREAEALELLSYVHYESAAPVSRGHREGVRAFALSRLGRIEEARELARKVVRLNGVMGPVLRSIAPECASA